MGVAAKIRAARRCGVVHCGVSARPSPTLVELATEFGLAPDPASYTEIDAAAARRLAELVLGRDLAYKVEIMAAARAAELTGRFLAQFGEQGVRFFTNGTFHEVSDPERSDAGWNPATAATFDTGVLILGPLRSGCLWVEDED